MGFASRSQLRYETLTSSPFSMRYHLDPAEVMRHYFDFLRVQYVYGFNVNGLNDCKLLLETMCGSDALKGERFLVDYSKHKEALRGSPWESLVRASDSPFDELTGDLLFLAEDRPSQILAERTQDLLSELTAFCRDLNLAHSQLT